MLRIVCLNSRGPSDTFFKYIAVERLLEVMPPLRETSEIGPSCRVLKMRPCGVSIDRGGGVSGGCGAHAGC